MIRKRYKDSRYREFEREFDEQFESETNKTEIYLDRSNRKLGGVCAGVARYFNIQPLFVRLGAVVLSFRRPRGRAPRLRSRVPHPR